MTRRVLFVVVVLVPAFCRGASAVEPVAVTLFPEAVVDDTLVMLGQIAKLSGGSATLRKRLERLDIADFKVGVAQTTIGRDQIRFRLLLGGLDAKDFRLDGADRTVVLEADQPATLRKILGAAERALRAAYPGDAADVTLTAQRGINVPTVELRGGERVRYDAKVKGPLADADRAVVEVALIVGGKLREVVSVGFEIAAAAPVTAGPTKEVSGIRPAHYTFPGTGPREYFIKSGDNVKIVARIGTARVEAQGEAAQNGQVGDMIRVRNVESNRTVHGRIDASGVIVVEY